MEKKMTDNDGSPVCASFGKVWKAVSTLGMDKDQRDEVLETMFTSLIGAYKDYETQALIKRDKVYNEIPDPRVRGVVIFVSDLLGKLNRATFMR
jgi:hypothetical protein